jgi:O-antigen/teichoic acid export membrane protein
MEIKNSKLPSTKKIIMGASFSLVGRIFSSFFGYINLIIIARALDIDQFGLYSFIVSLLTIAYIISNFGIENTLIYLIPQKKKQGAEEYRNLLKLIAVILIFSSITVILLILGFESKIFAFFKGNYSKHIIYIALLSIPIQAFLVYYRVVNQTNFKYIYSAMPENIVRPILYFLALFFLYLLGFNNISLILIAYLASYFFALISAHYFYQKGNSCNNFFIGERSLKLKFELNVVKDCFKFVNIQLLNQLSPFIIVYLLGVYQNGSSIGFFRAAFQTAALIAFALRSIEMVYTPIFSTLYTENKLSELKASFQKVTNWMLTIGGLICLTAIMFSKEVMYVFGKEFVAIVFVFQLLCLNQLINTLLGSVDYILIVSGYSKVVFYISFIQSFVVIITGAFFIKQLGLVGAAIAVILGTLVFKIILTVICYRTLKIHAFSNKYIFIVLTLIVNLVISFLVDKLNIGFLLKVITFPIQTLILFFIPIYLLGLTIEEKNKVINFAIKSKKFLLRS